MGLGTTFPISVVSLQNSVARAQIGTVTGAMNFFRALMASFTVAAFAAILLMALGADISLAGEHRGPVNSIPVADMIIAFRYVFGAAAVMIVAATLCMIAMEERPLAGPATAPAGNGGVGTDSQAPLSLHTALSNPRRRGIQYAVASRFDH